jgi:hypothetical protein
MMTRKRTLGAAVAILNLLVVAMLVFGDSVPAWAQSAASRFTRVIINSTLNVVGTTTLTGDVALGDDITVADDVTVSGDLASSIVKLTPSTLISLTNGATLTPAASLQPIGSPGTVYVTLGVCPAGLVTTLENAINATINLTDTGTSKLTANFAMGQYDTLTLIGDGTNCYELARANN